MDLRAAHREHMPECKVDMPRTLLHIIVIVLLIAALLSWPYSRHSADPQWNWHNLGSWENLLWGGEHREQTSRSQIWDHLGLVAGLCAELGIGEVVDHATRQNPAMRDRTVGEAVKAMGLDGLGLITQALYRVPSFFHNQPTSRLLSPR